MKYEEISEIKKQEVYDFFKHNYNNSVPLMSTIFGLSRYFIHKIINEKRNEDIINKRR